MAAKELARRVNLLELLGDAHPEVPEPPEEARRSGRLSHQ